MSEAEQKLCDLVARGFKTAEAAKQLGLTEGTAKQYRARNKTRIKELAVERLHDLLQESVAELAKLVSGTANWYYKFTVTNATIGTVTQISG